jgi:hypothetical protein
VQFVVGGTPHPAIKIIASMIDADDYGHQTTREMFSFSLTESLYAKIDWDHFDAMAFQKIAPDFHLTEWYSDALQQVPAQ